MAKKRPLVLIIRDGWGYRKEKKLNALAYANPQFTNYLMKTYPHTLLKAHGNAVGLPKGFQGNSEVGHMTIGSGRVILQSLERINQSINDGSFFKNKAFLQALTYAKKHQTALHLIGLLQAEGVHAHIHHLFALLDLCKQYQFTNVFVHVITDGRDAPPTKSLYYLAKLERKLKQLGFGVIATVSGRYYAMDRDKRWQRTQKAYEVIVEGKGPSFESPRQYILASHKQGVTDEFILPGKWKQYSGFANHDAVIFYNFRTDRPRQFTQAVVESSFKGFKRKQKKVFYVAMTKYYQPMHALVAFDDVPLTNLLGEVLSKHGLRQLRISETEKYAHVTFFFNGQREKPFPREDRILIPSPKVPTYDLQPEMSAYEIAKTIVKEMAKEKYDVIITNLVNGDMVGHTGVWKACVKAVKVVDACVQQIVEATLAHDGTALIFADHGNIEDQTPAWRTSHTVNKVPFILVSAQEKLKKVKLRKNGTLADIAPTVLDLLHIKQPKEMTGKSLLVH